ncbi:hypothetical protein H9L39_10779 [Fusarium oxysporum f. sp. albedinis]|nr:hypothetical protein H9L39_10779 [Fusarium oxysporum f. sp. albedinis]
MSFLDHAMCVEYRETIAGTNAGWVWNGLSWFSWGCKWRRRWRWSVGGAGPESKEDLKMNRTVERLRTGERH